MDNKNPFNINSDNVAVPEIHNKKYEEIQKLIDEDDNRELEKQEIVYDNVAIPEIHIRRKKK